MSTSTEWDRHVSQASETCEYLPSREDRIARLPRSFPVNNFSMSRLHVDLQLARVPGPGPDTSLGRERGANVAYARPLRSSQNKRLRYCLSHLGRVYVPVIDRQQCSFLDRARCFYDLRSLSTTAVSFKDREICAP